MAGRTTRWRRAGRDAPRPWFSVSVRIVTAGGGAVSIALSINGRQILTQDAQRSRGPHPGRGPGGIRGDNCQFFFRDFTVTAA